MLEKAKSAAKCRFSAEREVLCDLQDYPSPGMRVMQRVADAALAKVYHWLGLLTFVEF